MKVELDEGDVLLLIDALDSHEYWQVGDRLPRNDGAVVLPEDDSARWEDVEPSDDEVEAIEEVRACRALGERLHDTLRAVAPQATAAAKEA